MDRTAEHGGANDHEAMIREHHLQFLWTDFATLTLGAWLIVSPLTFDYRSRALAASDILSGLAMLGFSLAALRQRWDLFRWGTCFTGLWLLLAPLVFWAPTPFGYVNDTLVGTFAIALSILVPGMPGRGHHVAMMAPGPDVPPGWSYNPSTWLQRAPAIALAFVGFFISRYLAAYQLGYIPHAWDPFFGESTVRVLSSNVSRMWPISDAGFGAMAYMVEALSGLMGDEKRWRTMPWMVLMFGVLVIPLGLTHVVLVISQPVVVGYWCTLCLVAAAVMLVMIPLVVDEVVAMCQFVARTVRDGKPFWSTFWLGGTVEHDETKDERTPAMDEGAGRTAPATVWGVTVPWGCLASTALGVWLMFSPWMFGVTGRAADSDHLVGALIITTAVVATAEVVRAGRYLNVLFGLWIAAANLLLSGATTLSTWNNVLVGLLVVATSLPRGRVAERYGAWSRFVV